MQVVPGPRLLLVLGVVAFSISGCGSVAKLGRRSVAPAAAPPAGALVAGFTATVDPSTGHVLFRSETPAVAAQSASYGAGDDVTLRGAGTYDRATGVLSGSITLNTTGPMELYDARVVISRISSSSVSVTNADGVTPVANGSAYFWSYAKVNRITPAARTWRFTVPGGEGFTFRAQVWANVWKYSAGDGGTLQSVCFVSRTRGWAAGAAGKILVTTDGATWTPQVSGTGQHLNGISFVDDRYGWAVGNGGTILATTNGGRTWRPQEWRSQPQDFTTALHAVRFASRTLGWVAGDAGTILRTTDGGASWARVASGSTQTLHDIEHAGSTRVWAVGSGPSIFYSADGGVTWSAQTAPGTGALAGLTGVDFADGTTGIAVGGLGTALRTTNGGQTWTPIDCGVGTANLEGVRFATPNLVYVVGQSGLARCSLDGGVTWAVVNTMTVNDLLSIDGADTDYAWAVGRMGTVIRTTNGSSAAAATWSGVTRGTSSSLNAIDFLNDTEGWAVGIQGTVLRTTDGGSSWQPVGSGTTHTLTGVKAQSVPGGTRAWIVGGAATLRYIDDHGANWTPPLPPGLTSTLADIEFATPMRGIACGSGGVILRTEDGGATWSKVTSGTVQSLNAVSFADDLNGWVVGSIGTILVSNDGGATWNPVSAPLADSLFDVRAVDADHAWICGQNGRILALAGGSWTVQESGTSVNLKSIDFAGTRQGWAAGINGTLLRTEDGGASWMPASSGTSQDINRVLFRNGDDAWIVGANGLIQRFH